MTSGSGWMRIAAALTSGLMVAGLFPPYDLGVLAWVAMMPLLWALGSLAGKRAAWKGFGLAYLGGAVSGLIQFNWLETVSWLGAILLPVYLAVYWGLFGAFAATLRASGLRRAFCLASVWAGLEWLRGWLFTGFGWNGLGVGLHETPTVAQGADLLGVAGLSLMLVFFQAALVGYRPGRWRNPAAAGLLVLAAFGYGKFRIAGEARAETLRLKVLLVQLDIPQEAGRVLWTDLEIHQAYEEETLKALEALKDTDRWPDWVIWPETALTGRILKTNDGEWGTWQINMDTIAQVRAAGPFSLIYGVNELEAEKAGDNLVPSENGRAYNSIAVMSPEDKLQTFRKRHLVIFGETIPFVNSIPLLRKIYEQQSGMAFGGSFTPGDSLEPLPIKAGGKTIGAIPTVCFEDSVGRLTRKFVREGPQVIVNVTNDGWFKRSPAAAQHFANARFRAIELRRPMLRCANTGVSGAIDSAGVTTHLLTDGNGSHFTRGSLLAELRIPLRPGRSPYARIGDWGILAVAAAGIVLALTARRSAER